MNLTDADVADILALLDSLPYDELDLRTTRFRLILRRTPDGWTRSGEILSAAQPGTGATAEPGRADDAGGLRNPGGGSADPGPDARGVAVRAPLPGTFYRAPRPGAAAFVEVGSRVGAEDVVGIVETMKLMNSVPAGTAGTVAEICLANGEFAAQGTTLMRIEADG